jgi:competence protein ComEC
MAAAGILAGYLLPVTAGRLCAGGMAAAAVLLFLHYTRKYGIRRETVYCGILGLVFLAGMLRENTSRIRDAGMPETVVLDTVCTAESTKRTEYGYSCVFSSAELPGKARILLTEPVRAGEVISGHLELKRIRNPGNPGEWDSETSGKIRGIYYTGKITEIRRTGRSRFSFAVLRGRIGEILRAVLPQREAGLAAAILAGEDAELDGEIRDSFRAAGISHILAISGMHVTLVFTMIQTILSKLTFRRRASVCSLAAVWIYTFLTGGAAATLRAALICTVTALQPILHGREERLNTYCCSALLLILAKPLYLRDPGFQLSYVCTMSLTFFQEIPGRLFRLPKCVRRVLAPSIAVTAGSIPVTLYWFYQICPYQVIVNLLILPCMSVLFGTGAAVLAVYPVWKEAAEFGAGALFYLLRFLCRTGDIVSGLPGAVLTLGRPRIMTVLLYYAAWILLLTGPARRRKAYAVSGAAVLLCVISAVFPQYRTICTFLNVGQGDCCVIESGRQVFIIDAGPSYTAALEPYLKSRGITRIDAVFATHSDRDHTQGLMKLLQDEDFTVGQWILPEGKQHKNRTFALIEAAAGVTRIRAGDSIQGGSCRFLCLSPIEGVTYPDENSASLVLKFTADDLDILLCGDADQAAEELFSTAAGSCEILKAGHHGSSTSTGTALLKTVQPRLAVISCDREGGYGHPHRETVERLEDAGVRYLVTDDVGAVQIRSFLSKWYIHTGP